DANQRTRHGRFYDGGDAQVRDLQIRGFGVGIDMLLKCFKRFVSPKSGGRRGHSLQESAPIRHTTPPGAIILPRGSLPIGDRSVWTIINDPVCDRLGKLGDHLQALEVDVNAKSRSLAWPELSISEVETLRQIIPLARKAGGFEQHRAGEWTAGV